MENSFPLEILECPDLKCKPQCVPAVLNKAGMSWCFHSQGNPIRLCWSMCVCTCAWSNKLIMFFSLQDPLSTSLCSSQLHLFLSPIVSVSTDHSPVSVRKIQENKTNAIIYNWSHYFFSLFNPQTKHEVKTDVVVCFRHAKQLKPTPKSGCDIPWVFGAIHILLARLRYQHSPSIKLSD